MKESDDNYFCRLFSAWLYCGVLVGPCLLKSLLHFQFSKLNFDRRPSAAVCYTGQGQPHLSTSYSNFCLASHPPRWRRWFPDLTAVGSHMCRCLLTSFLIVPVNPQRSAFLGLVPNTLLHFPQLGNRPLSTLYCILLHGISRRSCALPLNNTLEKSQVTRELALIALSLACLVAQ